MHDVKASVMTGFATAANKASFWLMTDSYLSEVVFIGYPICHPSAEVMVRRQLCKRVTGPAQKGLCI